MDASHNSGDPAAPPDAVFTHGSIIRHVVVMTATGSIGLVSVFLVDFLSLLYVSWLRVPAALAGVGYATQVLFFMTSFSIGLAIAVTALVSRAIGRGDEKGARRLAGSCLVHVFLLANAVAAVIVGLRGDLLHLLGAHDSSFDVASRFLAITVPANVLLALGMSLSGLLRAAGDARRAMYVTLFGGVTTALFDPVLIFGLHLGVDGAAISTVISRLVFVGTGFWGCLRSHQLIDRPTLPDAVKDFAPMAGIAGPAILTNLAAPIANGYAMRIFSQFGEATMAAVVIVDRITPVAFGVLFALTGSVGPIIGQNVGAGLYGRVRRALIDCLILSSGYGVAVWFVLWFAAPHIADLFGAAGRTREIVLFYCSFGVVMWLFLGCLFVANAAFNNLGFPLLATIFNWGRATLGTIPFVTIGARFDGPEGGYLGIVLGAAAFGLAAMATSFFATARLERRNTSMASHT